jgi:uncharacterized protein YdeI (YjbR/CyaY-like superfamily)
VEEKNGIPAIRAATRSEWRKWLTKNHKRQEAVWLIIYHKELERQSVYYAEAVEEAICFGWIDSKPNKRDSESYYLFFAKRKEKSNWSKANRERAERMIAAGLMKPAGQAMIDIALKIGTWKALDKVQQNVIPVDLKKALQKNKKALTNFNAFPPSSKRIILEWLLNAKKSETRAKRIEETVKLAAKNIRANHYRQ